MTTLKDLIDTGKCNRARCREDTFLDDVIDMMAQFGESAISVVREDGSIAGITTDHDVMRAINCKSSSGQSICGETVQIWMTKSVSACPDSLTLQEAQKIMTEKRIHHLVVTHADELVGIITLGDLLAKIHECDTEELAQIRESFFSKSSRVAA